MSGEIGKGLISAMFYQQCLTTMARIAYWCNERRAYHQDNTIWCDCYILFIPHWSSLATPVSMQHLEKPLWHQMWWRNKILRRDPVHFNALVGVLSGLHGTSVIIVGHDIALRRNWIWIEMLERALEEGLPEENSPHRTPNVRRSQCELSPGFHTVWRDILSPT